MLPVRARTLKRSSSSISSLRISTKTDRGRRRIGSSYTVVRHVSGEHRSCQLESVRQSL